MLNGICIFPVIPMRKIKSDKSEMINQVLFGETFSILKKSHKWSYIELKHDQYQVWVDNKQLYLTDTDNTDFTISNKKLSNIKINSISQPLLLGSLIPKNKKLRDKIQLNENLSFCQMTPFNIWFTKISKKY